MEVLGASIKNCDMWETPNMNFIEDSIYDIYEIYLSWKENKRERVFSIDPADNLKSKTMMIFGVIRKSTIPKRLLFRQQGWGKGNELKICRLAISGPWTVL